MYRRCRSWQSHRDPLLRTWLSACSLPNLPPLVLPQLSDLQSTASLLLTWIDRLFGPRLGQRPCLGCTHSSTHMFHTHLHSHRPGDANYFPCYYALSLHKARLLVKICSAVAYKGLIPTATFPVHLSSEHAIACGTAPSDPCCAGVAACSCTATFLAECRFCALGALLIGNCLHQDCWWIGSSISSARLQRQGVNKRE